MEKYRAGGNVVSVGLVARGGQRGKSRIIEEEVEVIHACNPSDGDCDPPVQIYGREGGGKKNGQLAWSAVVGNSNECILQRSR